MVPCPNLKVIQNLLMMKLRAMFQSSQRDSVIPKNEGATKSITIFPWMALTVCLLTHLYTGVGGGDGGLKAVE